MNDQRTAALEIANGRRLAHAATRRHLRSLGFHASRREAAAILRAPEGELRFMRGRYLLESITHFGPTRIGKLLRRTGIGPGRLGVRLGEMTGRERHLLASHLAEIERSEAGAELTAAERRLIGDVFARLAHHGPAFATVAEKCQDLAPMQSQQAVGHGLSHPDRDNARPRRNGQRSRTAPGASVAPGADPSERRRWR